MLNSEKIYSGVEHADARSLLYATGHLQENIGQKAPYRRGEHLQ